MELIVKSALGRMRTPRYWQEWVESRHSVRPLFSTILEAAISTAQPCQCSLWCCNACPKALRRPRTC